MFRLSRVLLAPPSSGTTSASIIPREISQNTIPPGPAHYTNRNTCVDTMLCMSVRPFSYVYICQPLCVWSASHGITVRWRTWIISTV